MSRRMKMSRRDFLRATGMGSLGAGTYLIPGVGQVIAQDEQEVTVMF